jgi:hypothetical protein
LHKRVRSKQECLLQSSTTRRDFCTPWRRVGGSATKTTSHYEKRRQTLTSHSLTPTTLTPASHNLMSLLSKTTLLSAVFCLTVAVIAAVSTPQSILSNWIPSNKATIPKAEENPRYEAPLISCPESIQDPNQYYIVMLRQDHSIVTVSLIPSDW